MPNNHITQFLDYYIDLPSPQYAVLLKGKWGSGKTHFINEYKKTLDENKKKYIYVSLYGVTSYDEIETKFLESSNPELFNNKTIFTGKIASAFFNDKISGSIKEIKKSLSSLNSKDRILIFDDLERCSINKIDLLGYINHFVEHQSYNVILIANEEELDKSEKYKNIKEKLIGKTFELKSNSTLAYDSFLAELENRKDVKKEVFEKNKDLILQIFKQSKIDNLRILRQWILDFERLFDAVLSNHIDNIELIRDFLKAYLILHIETKIAKYEVLLNYIGDKNIYEDLLRACKIDDSLGLENTENDNNKAKIKKFIKFIKNYEIDTFTFNLVIDINLWINIIKNSNINSKEINRALENSGYYENKKIPSWQRLSSYYNLSDDEYIKLSLEVFEQFKKGIFENYRQNKFIVSMFLYFNEENLFKINIKQFLSDVKKRLANLIEINTNIKNMVLNKRTLRDKGYENISYFSSKHFTALNIWLDKKIDSKKEQILKNESELIIKAIKEKNSGHLFELLGKTNTFNEIYYRDIPILAYINVKELFEELKKTTGMMMHFFGGIIKDRYIRDFNSLLKEEEFLKELLDLVNVYIQLNNERISAYNMKKEIKINIEVALQKIDSIKVEK